MLTYAIASIENFINCIIIDPEIGLQVSRLSRFFVVFIPALGMHLIRIVTNRRSEQILLYTNYFICFLMLLFSQSGYYLHGMNTYSWGLFPEKAVLFDIINVLSVLTLLYNIAILLSAYRHNEKSFYRYRFNFLLFGTVTIAIMSLGNIPAMNGLQRVSSR